MTDELSAIKVGTDEVLIVAMRERDPPDAAVDSILAEFDRLGLRDRALVIWGDVQLAAVKR